MMMFTISYPDHRESHTFGVDVNRIISMFPLFYTRIDVFSTFDMEHTEHYVSDCCLPHRDLFALIKDLISRGVVEIKFAIDCKPCFNLRIGYMLEAV